MADTLNCFITEARKYKFSLISSLSENDIVCIWESASEFVKKQMLQHKGVMIPGLGMFTFSQKKIDVGSNKFILIQRPVFVLSEKFVQTHSLRYPKQHTSGQIPTVPLNFSVLSNGTSFDRNTVELCIKEIIQAMSRLLASNGNIQFDLVHIGRLLIRDSKVKMRFYREFITALDSSGELEHAFRPDTAHSVLSIMTNPSTPRGGTSSGKLVLPKIVEPKGADALNLECSALPQPPKDTGAMAELKTNDIMFEEKCFVDESRSVENGQVDTSFNLDASTGSELSGKLTPLSDRPKTDSHQLVPKPAIVFDVSSLKPKSVQSSRGSPRKHSTDECLPPSRPPTCSHLNSAGQELCYLCHQRALKNVFIDLSEDKKKREVEQDKLLQAHQQQKDLVAQVKEKIHRKNKKLHDREIASFNNDAAQRTKEKRTVKTSEFHQSYVFQDRNPTPPEFLKQNEYCSELDYQVNHKKKQLKEMKDWEERLEQEEQKELAEELAAYQESYIKEKIAKMEQHRKALAEQVRMKPTSLMPIDSKAPSHHPVFGVKDCSTEKLKEQKKKARELFMEQLKMVADKQVKMRHKAFVTQQEEADMLHKTRKDLIKDIRSERLARLEIRKSLEQSWNSTTKEKHKKQLEEVKHAQEPSILLHQQCEKYHRCKQCQRRCENFGHSNLLYESRYISGSRLMV